MMFLKKYSMSNRLLKRLKSFPNRLTSKEYSQKSLNKRKESPQYNKLTCRILQENTTLLCL